MAESITVFLTREHRHCDEILADAEIGISRQDWERAANSFQEFYAATMHHLAMEEDVLFPQFENRTGNTHGPTWVMRGEHREIRGVLGDLNAALARKDAQAFLGYADTLNIMLQQHNMKEENILYPMADQVLADVQSELVEVMVQIGTAA